ncbi:hypothetical protein [Methylobacterium platani]|uniref:Uncharacterized protein n=2 Tax=Methylobacterium platani TaxID=427683 RepID=A0A179S9G9_9HYPH|nr:hypothetical protein [Methylobacterium platani]KMO22320.1 hypothetical protein SQ03_00940 [Methylobacterium platani JCM 14648]OAS22541.1 hypothetical protein A5481_19300 [Methylobacterium platani]
MLKALAAIVARALAAAGRVTLVPVIEAGRLVWRTVRSALTPADPIGEAEAAFEAEAAEPAPAPAPLSAEEAWGRAALAHLMGEEYEAVLDEAATAYLDGLSVDQQVALSRHDNAAVGRHLLGERLLPSLPRPPTPAEFRAIEAARTAAAAAEAQEALRGDDAMHKYIMAVLDDLIAEPSRAA